MKWDDPHLSISTEVQSSFFPQLDMMITKDILHYTNY